LLSDGLPKTTALSEADAATLARCVGAVDFAQLSADITGATERTRNWYDRLVETPARDATAITGDNPQ
jgi:hypothetical protein